MHPYYPVGCRNRSGRDLYWFSLAVFCMLVWWLHSGSIRRCLGGIPLSLNRGVHALRSSVRAPSSSLLCDCPVDQTQLCARTFARPAFLPVCSECQEIPLFPKNSACVFLYWAGKNFMAKSCVISTESSWRLSTNICPGCILANHAQLTSLPGVDSVTGSSRRKLS